MDGRMTAQAKARTMGKIGSGRPKPNSRNGAANTTVAVTAKSAGKPIHRQG
jgi:hypothetical protein